MPRLEIFAGTRNKAQCRSCKAAIEWATMRHSGRRMPFDKEIVPIESFMDDRGLMVEVIDSEVTKSHFATCPDGNTWRKNTKTSREDR